MEWVQTTGSSIEAAKEAALDKLGVAEQDAEFEVLQQPKTGLFGRVRAEAEIRARVRPTAPRAKEDRRDRRRARTKDASDDGRVVTVRVEVTGVRLVHPAAGRPRPIARRPQAPQQGRPRAIRPTTLSGIREDPGHRRTPTPEPPARAATGPGRVEAVGVGRPGRPAAKHPW
jgi:hypothetical protein